MRAHAFMICLARRAGHASRFAVVVLGLLLVSALTAPAYNIAGHYSSVLVILDTDFADSARSFTAQDRALIGYCAELPDLSSQLSATSVYAQAVLKPNLANWFTWAVFDNVPTIDYKRMVSVQQLLHALTGGDSAAMRAVALGTARHFLQLAESQRSAAEGTQPDTLCAAGFALHMYGDTFAHRLLPWFDDPPSETLYPTGRGHGFDLHYPDDLHCNRVQKDEAGDTSCVLDPPENRYMVWMTYVSVTSELLTGADPTTNTIDLGKSVPKNCLALTSPLTQKICNDVQDIVANKKTRTINADQADYRAVATLETDLGAYLGQNGGHPSIAIAMTGNESTGDCDTNLAAALAKLGTSWPISKPPISHCAQTWNLYAGTAAAYMERCEELADNTPPAVSPDAGISLAVCKTHRPVANGSTWKSLASPKPGATDSLYQYAGLVFH